MRKFARGAVRLHLLHHAAQGGVHGAWMAAELAEHGYLISPDTLYRRCTGWRKKGLPSTRARR